MVHPVRKNLSLRTLREQPALSSQDLVGLVEERFGVSVHPRSIERALVRQEKKR